MSTVTPDSASGGDSSPAPTPAPPADVGVDQFPAALRAFGVVEALLARACTPGGGVSDDLRKLHAFASQDLGRVRREYRFPTHHASTLPPRLRYGLALVTDLGYADWVLRYGLACQAGEESTAESLKGKAWDAYLREPQYDALLGDLMPADFRARARVELARWAYADGTNPTASEDWDLHQQGLAARRQQPRRGVSTGLPRLDAALGGGLRGLTFLGGDTGNGKTTLALRMAVAALRAHPDLAVLFYSLDMAKGVIYDRLLCHEAGVTYDALLRANPDEKVARRLREADESLRKGVLRRLRVVERQQIQGKGGFRVSALWEHRTHLMSATGAATALVVIDYFGLINVRKRTTTPVEEDQRRVELLQQATGLPRAMGALADDTYLVVCEVRKPQGDRTGLSLDDLLGSSRLKYAADAVLLLERDGEARARAGHTAPLVLHVAKGRDGTTRQRLKVRFEYDTYQFLESGPGSADEGPSGRPAAPDHPESGPTPLVNPLASGRKGRGV
jgi:hypothetical protein